MIFSTDRCPLCNEKLDLEIRDLTTNTGTKIVFIYKCSKTDIVRNDSNTANVIKTHYQNESYKGKQLCEMLIPPYTLFHSESSDMTGVYKTDPKRGKPKKLLFRTTLLDLDYSKPQVVIEKLKLLVLFS